MGPFAGAVRKSSGLIIASATRGSNGSQANLLEGLRRSLGELHCMPSSHPTPGNDFVSDVGWDFEQQGEV